MVTYLEKVMAPHFRYSCLENPHGWRSLVGCSPWGCQESDTTEWLTFTFYFHALEKEMASHSSVLSWRIPGTGELGGLPSMGLHRVGHDWSNLGAAAAAYITKEMVKGAYRSHLPNKYFCVYYKLKVRLVIDFSPIDPYNKHISNQWANKKLV